MATEKLDTDVRREQLAQAALELIAESGLRRLGLAAVARRVGLVPSAIYRHFRSKDEVVDAALALVGERLLALGAAASAGGDDPLERLRRLLFLHAGFIGENRAIPRVVLSGEVFGGHPERRARVYGFVQTYLAGVARLVREGQETGSINPDLDADVLSLCFLGLLQAPAILWQLSGGAFDPSRHLPQAWEVFARGAAPARPRTRGGGSKPSVR